MTASRSAQAVMGTGQGIRGRGRARDPLLHFFDPCAPSCADFLTAHNPAGMRGALRTVAGHGLTRPPRRGRRGGATVAGHRPPMPQGGHRQVPPTGATDRGAGSVPLRGTAGRRLGPSGRGSIFSLIQTPCVLVITNLENLRVDSC